MGVFAGFDLFIGAQSLQAGRMGLMGLMGFMGFMGRIGRIGLIDIWGATARVCRWLRGFLSRFSPDGGYGRGSSPLRPTNVCITRVL